MGMDTSSARPFFYYRVVGFLVLAVLLVGYFYFIRPKQNTSMPTLLVTSTAFADGDLIPSNYTCDMDNVNPQIAIAKIPAGTLTLALIMDDPDIPESVKSSRGISVFDHWVIFNVPVTSGASEVVLEEASVPSGVHGTNGRGEAKYTGPCPPDREHRYFFRAYALDANLLLSEGASRSEVEVAFEGHILAEGVLMGRYERK